MSRVRKLLLARLLAMESGLLQLAQDRQHHFVGTAANADEAPVPVRTRHQVFLHVAHSTCHHAHVLSTCNNRQAPAAAGTRRAHVPKNCRHASESSRLRRPTLSFAMDASRVTSSPCTRKRRRSVVKPANCTQVWARRPSNRHLDVEVRCAVHQRPQRFNFCFQLRQLEVYRLVAKQWLAKHHALRGVPVHAQLPSKLDVVERQTKRSPRTRTSTGALGQTPQAG